MDAVLIIGIEPVVVEVDGDDVVERRAFDGRSGVVCTVKDKRDLAQGLAAAQRHEGRDLAVTTDFRGVFAEVAVRHLGVRDARAIFPGYAVDPRSFPGVLGSAGGAG